MLVTTKTPNRIPRIIEAVPVNIFRKIISAMPYVTTNPINQLL